MSDIDIIGRAFEIARQGSCRNLVDIRKQLKREGYGSADAHTAGRSIKKQLSDIMNARLRDL